MKELAALKNLTKLDLSETKLTDAGLKELAKLQSLTTLELRSNPGVTDASVKELKQLKQLITLDLRGTKVTNLGLHELRNALPKCNIFD